MTHSRPECCATWGTWPWRRGGRGAGETPEPDCHAALSAYLLGLWGIPHNVLEPIAFHENPERIEHDTIEVVDIAHLADRIAAELSPSPFQSTQPPLNVARLLQLGATPNQIDALRSDARGLLVHTRELLKR